MHVLTFAFIVIVAMTTIKVKGSNGGGLQLADFLKLGAHKDHGYLLDITSVSSEEDLRALLVNFTLDHSYKVVGESRYLFSFRSNDTEALEALTFTTPRARVTQFPVERCDQMFDMFGVGLAESGSWNYPDNSSVGRTLFLLDWTLPMSEDVCWETFQLEMRTFIQGTKGLAEALKPACHAVIATYPTRFLAFWQIEENVLQNAVQGIQPIFNGFGNTRLVVKRVIRI